MALTDPATAAPPQRFWQWETIIACVLVIAATAPGMLLIGVPDKPGAPENPLFRLYWLPIYGLIGVMCLVKFQALSRSWAALLLIGALVAWAFLSQAWSILPEVTGRRAFALLMTTLLGFYLAAALSPGRLVRVVAVGFAILAAGSAAVALTMPRLGVEHEVTLAGDWRGLWSTKNTLAEFMMLGAMAGLCAALISPGQRWRWLGAAGLCVFLLLMSKGKTSLLALGLAAGVIGVLSLVRQGPIPAVITAFVGGTVVLWGGFLAWVNPGMVLAAVGKDPSLTGRTDIWAAILRQTPPSPALGFGFGAFWEKASVPAQVIRKQTHWLVPSAHNGWLDLLVQVGWIGVVLFMIVLAATLVLIVARTFALHDGHFCIAFLAVFLLLSFSESVLEQHNNLPWALFVAIASYAFTPARLYSGARLHRRCAGIETAP